MASDSPPLTHERIVLAAMALADISGIDKLSMRSLASDLGVTAMSLYRYFKNKEALLDQMIDDVFAKIDVPTIGNAWRAEMHKNAHSTRKVLLEHPWAVGLIETRADPGPATLSHHNAVIGTLADAGFSMALVAKAFSSIDAYVYGFVLQEVTLPFDADEQQNETVQSTIDQTPPDDLYPHLIAFAMQHLAAPGYRFGDQFDFGLDLILDGLAKHLAGS